MSKGPGKVQRALAVIFKAEPNKLFGTDELVARVYLGEPVTETRRACIREALAKIGPALGVKLYRSGRPKSSGWGYEYRREFKTPGYMKIISSKYRRIQFE